MQQTVSLAQNVPGLRNSSGYTEAHRTYNRIEHHTVLSRSISHTFSLITNGLSHLVHASAWVCWVYSLHQSQRYHTAVWGWLPVPWPWHQSTAVPCPRYSGKSRVSTCSAPSLWRLHLEERARGKHFIQEMMVGTDYYTLEMETMTVLQLSLTWGVRISNIKVISGTEYVTLSRTDFKFHVAYTFPGSVLLARAFGIRMRSPATLLLAE